MPVLILGTYDENGVANAMNAAWGGMYDFNKITVFLSEHKTTANMRLKKGLTISFATKDTIAASDYVGIVSAKDVPNKVEKAGLHPFKSKFVDAPLFEEYPVTLECKIESFEEGTLVAEIVNVSVELVGQVTALIGKLCELFVLGIQSGVTCQQHGLAVYNAVV